MIDQIATRSRVHRSPAAVMGPISTPALLTRSYPETWRIDGPVESPLTTGARVREYWRISRPFRAMPPEAHWEEAGHTLVEVEWTCVQRIDPHRVPDRGSLNVAVVDGRVVCGPSGTGIAGVLASWLNS
ncbi:hypothetical protein [Streptomyces olivaceoviridis]|uniref:hypothetical protein n=1 Tax=Streptomyces olivaceoviridis TaxID=1921 RepID=UPI0036B18E32